MSKEVKAAIVGAIIGGIFTVIAARVGKGIIITFPPTSTPLPSEQVEPKKVTEKPEDTNTPTDTSLKEIDIRELTPLIGEDENFWEDASDMQDNLGNDQYIFSIFYGGDSYSQEITYPLDEKYKVLKGTIALSQKNNKIGDGVWLEFYDGKRCLGRTKHLKRGVRPLDFTIKVDGVKDLKIVSTASTMHLGAYILTNGFFWRSNIIMYIMPTTNI